jgi:hypothetical protein
MGKIPLPERIITSIYPILIFVSDPLCKKISIKFSILYSLFRKKKRKKKKNPRKKRITHSDRQIAI